MLLDIESKAFRGGILVCCVVYLVLCLKLQAFTAEDALKIAESQLALLIEKAASFNQVFSKFVRMCLEEEFSELTPYIKFCIPHLASATVLMLPPAIDSSDKEVLL